MERDACDFQRPRATTQEPPSIHRAIHSPSKFIDHGIYVLSTSDKDEAKTVMLTTISFMMWSQGHHAYTHIQVTPAHIGLQNHPVEGRFLIGLLSLIKIFVV